MKRASPMDDIEAGQAVTVENVFFKSPDNGSWEPCGRGAMWVGNTPDFRGDLFRVVEVDLPYVVVDMLCNSYGIVAIPPKRVVFDARHVTFRKMSEGFLSALLKSPMTENGPRKEGEPTPARRASSVSGLPPALAALLGIKPEQAIEIREISIDPPSTATARAVAQADVPASSKTPGSPCKECGLTDGKGMCPECDECHHVDFTAPTREMFGKPDADLPFDMKPKARKPRKKKSDDQKS